MEPSVENSLARTVARDGVHVVHFWAPWCDNSLHELEDWARIPEIHPDVSVTFVTVWNDGEVGTDTLDAHEIPERVQRLVVRGPKPEKQDRRLTILGLPLTWIPTTWVFNRYGLLAYAFSYGEVSFEQLNEAIQGAASDW